MIHLQSCVCRAEASGKGQTLSALSLQQVLLRRGECMLAVVCCGPDFQGMAAADKQAMSHYGVQRLTRWFYQEGKELICRNAAKELILLALQRQISLLREYFSQFSKTEASMDTVKTGFSCCGILIVKKRYYLFQCGNGCIFHAKKSMLPKIFAGKQAPYRLCRHQNGIRVWLLSEKEAYFDMARLQRGEAFLLGIVDKKDDFSQLLYAAEVTASLLRRGRTPLQRRLEMLMQKQDGIRLAAGIILGKGGDGSRWRGIGI